jgi:DNA polymerase-1
MPVPSGQPRSNVLALEYVVSGPRTAGAVAEGKSRLVGVGLVGPDGEARFVTEDIAGTLRSFNGLHRVYDDAVFALAVEQTYGLPHAGSFDDISTMLALLNGSPTCWDVQLGRCDDGRPREAGGQRNAPVDRASFAVAAAQWLQGLHGQLLAQVAAEGVEYVYREVELPVILPTAAMSMAGIRVDIPLLNQLLECYRTRLAIARFQICEAAGRQINPDSHLELCEYLFNDLKLPVNKWTFSGVPSTCDLALKRLDGLHPVVAAIRAYNEARPVVSALESLLSYVDQATQRVRPELRPLGAATGRFSCCRPNLQAVPKAILEAFVPDDRCVLLDADFSQIELRVLAHFSQDPGFIEAYATGQDIHRRTAAAALGVPEEKVSPEARDAIGKPVNFGIVYGETEYGLAENLGIGINQTQSFIDGYFRMYPMVRQWIEQIQSQALRRGCVETLYGRRRYLPDISSRDPKAADHALRQAVNTVIQGTAADINKLAIARLHRALPSDCPMLLTVHDSVLLEVPSRRAEEIAAMVRDVMEIQPPGFSVPIKAEVRSGRTWRECKAPTRREESKAS